MRLGMTNNLIRQWADYNDAALTSQKAVAQRSGWIMGVLEISFSGSRSKSS